MQVAFPGMYVFFKTPFRFLALPALAMVFIVTLVMLRFTPKKWMENPDKFWLAYSVFTKVSVTFLIYMVCALAPDSSDAVCVRGRHTSSGGFFVVKS
jgi:hypothetical protein